MPTFEGTLFVAIALPDQWPPDHTVKLLEHAVNGGTIVVTVDPVSSFTFRTASLYGETEVRRFWPVQLEPGSRLVLSLSWRGPTLSLGLNGQDLPAHTGAQVAPLIIASKPEHRAPAATLLYPELNLHRASREVERLFLDTVRDIDAKLLSGSRYELLRAAGLLRQLLLDDLVHQVNRPYRCRMKFCVLNHQKEPPGRPATHWRALDPTYFPHVETLEVSLQKFLAIPVLRHDEVTARVKDVIKACANAKGGVHYGSAADVQEELVLDFDGRFKFSAVEVSLESLAGLCRVVLVGLRPLVLGINAQPHNAPDR